MKFLQGKSLGEAKHSGSRRGGGKASPEPTIGERTVFGASEVGVCNFGVISHHLLFETLRAISSQSLLIFPVFF